MKNVLLGCVIAFSFNVAAVDTVAKVEPVAKTVMMTEFEYSHEYEIALKQVKHKDKGKAFDTMLQYAKYGEKVAQYMVANFYLSGVGTEANAQEGLVWMGVAIEQHTPEWEQAFEKLTRNFNAEQMAYLNKLIDERKALYGASAQHMSCDIGATVTGSNRRYHTCTKRIDTIKRVTVVKYE